MTDQTIYRAEDLESALAHNLAILLGALPYAPPKDPRKKPLYDKGYAAVLARRLKQSGWTMTQRDMRLK